MRLLLIAVGRLKTGPEGDLYERYAKRLTEIARTVGVGGLEFREIEEGRARRPEQRQRQEATAVEAAIPAGAKLVLCDERGKALTSLQFASDLGAARDRGAPAYALIIGGPDGFDPALRNRAEMLIAFGAMTWPHQLVRIMAAEQLYRALTLLAGHPYHRR
ncbi:MAG TPA: 23S rRNA (pseudouridine(1915)-N(3))-methyltransferase RlmH [Roseiarcus sp.]|nr:23S rRNA (pseudouridine(1915)-N(3))-methyltransferase RlmH [Roseiarcus sp.]